jgi:hypothetical protein
MQIIEEDEDFHKLAKKYSIDKLQDILMVTLEW